jgi:hypothetical protein
MSKCLKVPALTRLYSSEVGHGLSHLSHQDLGFESKSSSRLRQMPEEATSVGFHAATGASTTGTDAHTHALTPGEVLGVFRLDCVRCDVGCEARAGWLARVLALCACATR